MSAYSVSAVLNLFLVITCVGDVEANVGAPVKSGFSVTAARGPPPGRLSRRKVPIWRYNGALDLIGKLRHTAVAPARRGDRKYRVTK